MGIGYPTGRQDARVRAGQAGVAACRYRVLSSSAMDTTTTTQVAGRGIHTAPGGGETNSWITPPWLPKLLGPFDLDPCASIPQPWHHAAREYTIEDDGLAQPWEGRVWLNPPYGKFSGEWLRRLAEHGDGIALVAARVEVEWFHRWAWGRADAVFFRRGRLAFFKPNGQLGPSNAGHGSVLVAYGQNNVEALRSANERDQMRLPGRLVLL